MIPTGASQRRCFPSVAASTTTQLPSRRAQIRPGLVNDSDSARSCSCLTCHVVFIRQHVVHQFFARHVLIQEVGSILQTFPVHLTARSEPIFVSLQQRSLRHSCSMHLSGTTQKVAAVDQFRFLMLRKSDTLLLVERTIQTALMSCTSVDNWTCFKLRSRGGVLSCTYVETVVVTQSYQG